MKQTLATFFALVWLLAITNPACAQNRIETLAKADTGPADPADPVVKMDATIKTGATANTEPMIKTDAHKTESLKKAQVLPPPDGHELALSCKAEVEGFDAGYCLGLVEGVIASMRLCSQRHSIVTLGEAADAMAKYLESHPDKLKRRDVVLARKALAKAYPCGPSAQ
jgi:hypothetical protein